MRLELWQALYHQAPLNLKRKYNFNQTYRKLEAKIISYNYIKWCEDMIRPFSAVNLYFVDIFSIKRGFSIIFSLTQFESAKRKYTLQGLLIWKENVYRNIHIDFMSDLT